MTRIVLVLTLLAIVAAGCGGSDQPQASSPEGPPAGLAAGWETDFSKHSVPFDEFMSGGPGKDGIPAVDEPQLVATSKVGFLADREPVIELVVDGEARAYPIQVLIWHEIVNDVVGGVPVAVTFCPLCNTSIVFDRRLDGRTLDFGTTGNLRNSDLVMYDRQTESWWQQFGGEALVGELTEATLEQLPSRVVAWEAFRREHPDGRVLSRDTGHTRSYGENPYSGYDSVDSPPFFPARNSDDDRLPPKERVVLVERGGETVVVPFSVLRERNVVEIEVGGEELTVRWRAGVSSSLDDDSVAGGRDVGTAEVLRDGELVPFDQPFWFAVAAFRPDARIVR
ncbi:MAG: DUF3179 domain-containing protein [Gaiellaceae bacterium]